MEASVKRYVAHLLAAVLVALCAVLPVESEVQAEAARPLVVVVGASTGITDISLATLRDVFTGLPTPYRGGKHLLPLNQALGTPDRQLFDRVVLGLAPSDVGQFWIDRRIRSESQAPRTLPSVAIGLRVVAAYPGAIMYTSAPVVDASVRVLKVDGKLPSDPGYLLTRR